MSYLDELTEVTPLDPERKKYDSFLDAMEGMRSQNAGPAPGTEETAAPIAPVLPPRRDVGQVEGALKGFQGAATDLVGLGFKGAGIEASHRINPYLEKIARISPLAKDIIYTIGVGDDTLVAQGKADLKQILSGEGGRGEIDLRETSNLYQAGAGIQRAGYAAFGIDEDVQQTAGYKVTNTIGQAIGYVGAAVGAGAVGGPAASQAAIMGLMATNTIASEYDRAMSLGADHAGAIAQAEDVALVTGILSMISLGPLVGAASKSAAAHGLVKNSVASSFKNPLASVGEKAFKKAGFNVRSKSMRNVIAGGAAGIGEGMEEYTTGVYSDTRAQFYGSDWAPNKTWAQMYFGPERAEEFVLGVIGGAGASVIMGGNDRVEFTDDRKQAARIMYHEVFSRRTGIPMSVMQEQDLEPLFRRAETEASQYADLDLAAMSRAYNDVRARAESAATIEEELQMLMVGDALAEMLPHARAKGKSVTPEEARAAARNNNATQDTNDSQAEEEAVSGDMLTLLKKHGVEAFEVLEQSIRGAMNNPALSAIQKRAAAAASRVSAKIRRGRDIMAKTTQEDQQADELEAEARQIEARVTEQSLTATAYQQREKLLAAWSNPKTRISLIHKLMGAEYDFKIEETGRMVTGTSILSAMLPLSAPLPNVAEGTTMRQVIDQALIEEDNREQQEMQEQMEAAQDEAEQQQIKEQASEQKIIQQDAQILLHTLKMDDQIKELNRKESENELRAEVTQEKLEDQRAQIKEGKEKRADDKQKAARKEKAAETKATGKQVVESLRGKTTTTRAKTKVQGKTASTPVMITKAMKQKLLDAGFTLAQVKKMTPAQAHKALNTNHAVGAKTVTTVEPSAAKAKAELSSMPPKQAAKVLSTKLSKTKRTKKQEESDEAHGLDTVGDLMMLEEQREQAAKHRAQQRKKKRKGPNTEDPTNDAAKSPHEESSEVPPERVHKGKTTKIVYKGKVITVRSLPTFVEDGVTMVRWEEMTEDKGPQKGKAMPLRQFQKLMHAAKHGTEGTKFSYHKATGSNPPPVEPTGTQHTASEPHVPHSKGPHEGVEWYDFFYRLGDRIRKRLGPLGELVRRGGIESERIAQQAQGRHDDDVERATEVSGQEYKTGKDRVRTNKGVFSTYYNMMRGMVDLDSAVAEWEAKPDGNWKTFNLAFLRGAHTALAFNPSDLGRKMSQEALPEIKAYAEKKAQEWRDKQASTPKELRWKQQHAIYWERYAAYVGDLMSFDGDVQVMHHLDSLSNGSLKAHLMPLMASNHHDTLAYNERKNYALDPENMAGRVPNHTYHGVSTDFLEKIRKNDPEFQAEVQHVVEEINKVLNDNGTEESSKKAQKLLAELGLDLNVTPEQIRERVQVAAIEMLTSERPTIFSRSNHKFGSFVQSRMGVWGPTVVDWSYGSNNSYLDKAYRDTAEHQMYREFLTTEAAADSEFQFKYHSQSSQVQENGGLGTIEQAMKLMLAEAKNVNPDFPMRMLTKYLDEIRGRGVTNEGWSREAVGGLARYQYASKLGNPSTLIRNATILGSLAMMLGPKHVFQTFMNIPRGYGDMARRAKRSGAASFQQDAAFEFERHTQSSAGKLKRTVDALSVAGLFLFTKEEVFLRTAVAEMSRSAFEEHINSIQGTDTEGAKKLFGLTPDEAKHNLVSMFELTKEDVAKIESRTATEKEMDIMLNKVLYNGSGLINFRSGPNFLPEFLAGQGTIPRFIRVFNSFVYNIWVAQAKHLWGDMYHGIKDNNAGQLRGGIKRTLAVYTGAVMTKQVADALLDAVGDKDDEEDLVGDTAMAKFTMNRLLDLSTVGLLGKVDRPYDLGNMQSFVLGVHGRTLKSASKWAQGSLVGLEDFFQGDFSEGTKQIFDATGRLLTDEITHLKGARSLYRKYGVNRRDYDIARQVQGTMSKGKKSYSERLGDEAKSFGVNQYAKERDAVVNALAGGKYFDSGDAARIYLHRIIGREDGITLDSAVQRARASVMMKAPLSEYSKTSDPKKAKEDLMAFAAEFKDRRGTEATRRLIAAHLAYVGAVAAIFPKKK